MSKTTRNHNAMGRIIRKSNDSNKRTSTSPQNNQKPISVAEMRDEDIEEMPEKEFKKILRKLFRANEKRWKEFKEFKNHVAAEIKQMNNGILNIEHKVESLINRKNLVEVLDSGRVQPRGGEPHHHWQNKSNAEAAISMMILLSIRKWATE